MKRILFIIIIISVILSGCSNNQKQTLRTEINAKDGIIKELETKNSKLANELDEANNRISKIEQLNDKYAILSNISLEFIRGQTEGDIEKMRSLISDDINLLEENNKIFGIYESYDEQIKYILHDKDSKITYQDMVIQGFGYYEDYDAYVIHIREFYKDELGVPVSPPTFLNLYFREIDNNWKIVEFSFDV